MGRKKNNCPLSKFPVKVSYQIHYNSVSVAPVAPGKRALNKPRSIVGCTIAKKQVPYCVSPYSCSRIKVEKGRRRKRREVMRLRETVKVLKPVPPASYSTVRTKASVRRTAKFSLGYSVLFNAFLRPLRVCYTVTS